MLPMICDDGAPCGICLHMAYFMFQNLIAPLQEMSTGRNRHALSNVAQREKSRTAISSTPPWRPGEELWRFRPTCPSRCSWSPANALQDRPLLSGTRKPWSMKRWFLATAPKRVVQNVVARTWHRHGLLQHLSPGHTSKYKATEIRNTISTTEAPLSLYIYIYI